MRFNHLLVSGLILIVFLVVIISFIGFKTQKMVVNTNNMNDFIINSIEKETLLYRIISTSNIDSFSQLEKKYRELDKCVHDLKSSTEANLQEILTKRREFDRISEDIITIHKELISQQDVFSDKYPIEKEQRHSIRVPLFAIDDRQLTEDVGFMQYYSKETLYQQKEQKNMDEWLESIEDVKEGVRKSSISDGEKEYLLSELNSYKQTATVMGDIAIQEKKIKYEERLKIVEINNINKEMGFLRDNVVSDLKINLEKNKTLILLMVFIVLFSLICLGVLVSILVSKPLFELTNCVDEIGKGNFDVCLDKKCMIKEIDILQGSLNRILATLKLAVLEKNKKKSR